MKHYLTIAILLCVPLSTYATEPTFINMNTPEMKKAQSISINCMINSLDKIVSGSDDVKFVVDSAASSCEKVIRDQAAMLVSSGYPKDHGRSFIRGMQEGLRKTFTNMTLQYKALNQPEKSFSDFFFNR